MVLEEKKSFIKLLLCGSDNLIPELPKSAYTDVVSTVRSLPGSGRHDQATCSKNIYFVESRSVLSIAMELLLLRLNFVFI